MEHTLLNLFCLVDDFCLVFLPQWHSHLLQNRMIKRKRRGQLSVSEIMTLYIHFQQSHYRNFKNYYL